MRFLRIAEFFFWVCLAWGIATQQSTIVLKGLDLIFGSVQSVPTIILQNISLVSPIFPLTLLLLAVVRLRIEGISFSEGWGFHRSTIRFDILLGSAVGLISVLVTVCLLQVMSKRFPMPPFSQMPLHQHMYFATIGAIVPAFSEELYFRRFLLHIGRDLALPLLIPLSAGAFALWHIGSPIYLAHTFVLGLIWAILYIRTKRLATSVIAHAVANIVFGLLLAFGFNIL